MIGVNVSYIYIFNYQLGDTDLNPELYLFVGTIKVGILVEQ